MSIYTFEPLKSPQLRVAELKLGELYEVKHPRKEVRRYDI